MKSLIAAFLMIASANAFSAEVYDCNFGGSHFWLKMYDDHTISLENKFQKFPCEKQYVNFPGTEIQLTNLVCKGRYKETTYGMSQYDEETIILSPNVIFSKDVTCKKME